MDRLAADLRADGAAEEAECRGQEQECEEYMYRAQQEGEHHGDHVGLIQWPRLAHAIPVPVYVDASDEQGVCEYKVHCDAPLANHGDVLLICAVEVEEEEDGGRD